MKITKINDLKISIALFLVAIFSLSGCCESNRVEVKPSEYFVTSEVVSKGPGYYLNRYENKEVICYSRGEGLWCHYKGTDGK